MKKLSSIAMVSLLVVLNYTAAMAQSSADKPPPSSTSSPKRNNKPELTLTKSQMLSGMQFTFLGIDLTEARFVGSHEIWKSEDEIKRLGTSWNRLMVSESDKFNVRRAFKRDEIYYNVDICIDNNKNINYEGRITSNSDSKLLSEQDIKTIVQNYDFKDLTGLGLMLIVESFDKSKSRGTMAVTFVNLNNQEVVFYEKLSGPSGGMGLRNHWARSIFEVLIQVEKKRYRAWLKDL